MRSIKRALTFAGAGTIAAALTAVALEPLVRSAHIIHPKTGAAIIIPGKDGDSTLLHNGWRITPAGRPVQTGDMLLGGAISPDGRTLAIANAGYNVHAIHLVDIVTEKEIARLPVVKTWNGIAWSPDGKTLYASGGVNNTASDIYRFQKDEAGGWQKTEGFKLIGAVDKKICVAGMTTSADGGILYALNDSDNKLYAISTADGSALFNVAVGDHPINLRLSRDGKQAYVANWGGSEVAVVDISGPANSGVIKRLSTGAHPNDIALSSDGRLFISCGSADAVTVYDASNFQVMETIRTTLTPRSPSGSTPNAVAVTRDNKRLYIANADNNDVCVVDISSRGKSRIEGFIPTGWYPTALLTSPDGGKVIIGSGKGAGTRPNPTRDPKLPMSFPYIGTQLNGVLSFVDAPDSTKLKEFTKQVVMNTPYKDTLLSQAPGSRKTAVPRRVGEASPIKYVLYVIKENRTYDQVFGDMPKGNGDPSLCLFGNEVTPNQHALADQFVLLDNLYCNGEVSQDGHPWSDAAYVTDFTQRAWVTAYSRKGEPPGGAKVTDPPAGYLWESAGRKGLTFRSYGEMSGHKSLQDHTNLSFVGKGGPNQPAPGRDTDRADIFIQEFKEFEAANTIPRFMVMSLGENHTRGTAVGAYTPKAAVASNDLALGKIVDAISHSSVWKEFAIFVIEDDAQNGPDHVDSHRTTGLIISPYTRRGAVDSTMYQTASMIRTMELILGLDPLSQYDAAATPMFESFTDKADLAVFTALPAKIDLNAKNGQTAYGAAESSRMNWSEYDRVDENALNRILWHSIKGRNVPMPAPVRTVVSGRPQTHSASAKRDDD
jgi:YVTN family beta-propeller protein